MFQLPSMDCIACVLPPVPAAGAAAGRWVEQRIKWLADKLLRRGAEDYDSQLAEGFEQQGGAYVDMLDEVRSSPHKAHASLRACGGHPLLASGGHPLLIAGRTIRRAL